MPTVFRYRGLRFYFWSREHLPIHIRVECAGAKAKFVLEPEIKEVESYGFSPKDIKRIKKAIEQAKHRIYEALEEHVDE